MNLVFCLTFFVLPSWCYLNTNLVLNEKIRSAFTRNKISLSGSKASKSRGKKIILKSQRIEESFETESLKLQSTNSFVTLDKICKELDVSSPNGNHKGLFLSSNVIDDENLGGIEGERGLFTKTSIKEDDVIFWMPLSSCVTDDTIPEWLLSSDDEEYNLHLSNHPSHWATRSAASFLQVQMDIESNSTRTNPGLSSWISLLPPPEQLRASLPVHWSDTALSNARCCALELEVDSMYFARGEAVDPLFNGLKRKQYVSNSQVENDLEHSVVQKEEQLARQCHRALDLVQTRSCRVERLDGMSPPIRVLAPIFDLINHGGKSKSNAFFELKSIENVPHFVVRATTNIRSKEEILIDYGDSTRPAWKCLSSYGFVPQQEEDSIAEVFMDGVRYEVGPYTIPVDMVESAIAAMEAENYMPNANKKENETILTSAAALRIAKRVSDVAFDLLLSPDDDDDENLLDVQAANLAASLRWSQYRVLMSCVIGLREYASNLIGVPQDDYEVSP